MPLMLAWRERGTDWQVVFGKECADVNDNLSPRNSLASNVLAIVGMVEMHSMHPLIGL
jgi:hypothetical protein